MKVTLHYNFNDVYSEGRDVINVIKKDYPYTVEVKETETLKKLLEENYNRALRSAAYDTICDLAGGVWDD